jgi:hypothetical protein
MRQKIPLLEKEGWTRLQENGSVPKWRGRGGQFGEMLRPENSAELTTPSAAIRWLRTFFDAAATPPIQGGEF